MGKKQTDPPPLDEVSRPEDRRILEIPSSFGDDLSRRRHTILFCHRLKADRGTDPAIFAPVAAEAAALGFTIASHRSDALIVEGHKRLDPENLEALSTRTEEIAETAGVRFDGWECAVDEEPEPN